MTPPSLPPASSSSHNLEPAKHLGLNIHHIRSVYITLKPTLNNQGKFSKLWLFKNGITRACTQYGDTSPKLAVETQK